MTETKLKNKGEKIMNKREYKTKVFSVYDEKTKQFGQPICADRSATAERMFADSIVNPNTRISQYPSEFSLWQIGEYDIYAGKFENLVEKRYLTNGVDVDVGNGRRPNEQITTSSRTE